MTIFSVIALSFTIYSFEESNLTITEIKASIDLTSLTLFAWSVVTESGS